MGPKPRIKEAALEVHLDDSRLGAEGQQDTKTGRRVPVDPLYGVIGAVKLSRRVACP
jgi:hypothetical protein